MKASGAISIVFSSISLASVLARQEIVQRVVERLHVGIDLFLHVAGQEAEPFARFHRRAAEDDLVHMAVDHLVHGHGNGEVGLAGARRPDAEGQFMGEEVAHVIRLRGVRGSTVFFASRSQASRRRTSPSGRRRARRFPRSFTAHATAASISPGSMLLPASSRHRAPERPRRPRPCITQQRKLIAPAQDMHGQEMLDLGEVAVELSAQLDQQTIVGEFKQQFDRSEGGSDESRRRFAAEW
jgi:hypothetical protein